MLKEDYIMRLFQQFNEMLAKWLNKKRFDNVELVVSFNDEVVKPYLKEDLVFFISKNPVEIDSYFQEVYADKNERLSRLEILAESLFQYAQFEEDKSKKIELFEKTIEMLELINSMDNTYSITRENRLEELKQAVLNHS